MIFPDGRNDNYYNEDFLDKPNKNFLDGFDWATEMAVDNFFDNNFGDLGMCENAYLTEVLEKEVPDSLKQEYDMEFTFGDRETEKREIKTYADYLRMKLLEWIEMDRDELITSMIDGMDEDIYNAIRNKVLKENETKENKKDYYDSRKYIITGKKET